MEIDFIDKYQELLNQPVPEIKKAPKTFLEISGYPHYENVVSNILQFFLSPDEEHNFELLFIQSLVNCINSKSTEKIEISGNNFLVEREYKGLGQSRMDLLVLSKNKDRDEDELAIIIECKIWAALYNNLSNYWDAIPQSSKIGVILSLYSENSIKHKGFVNITFQEYQDEILKNMGIYLLNASEKYLIFLREFLNNITSLKSNRAMSVQYKFYYENIDKINELAKMRDGITRIILSTTVSVGKQLGYQVTNTRADYYRCWLIEGSNDIYFTFLVETNRGINRFLNVILEISDKNFAKKDLLISDSELRKIANTGDFEIGPLHGDGKFMHIMHKDVEMNLETITNLEEQLIAINAKYLTPIYKRVVHLLALDKNGI